MHRRDLFLQRYKCEHLQGDGEWSVHGSPCDAIHGTWRKLCDRYEDHLYGFDLDPFKRKSVEKLVQDSLGDAPRDCENLGDAVLSRIWAHRSMPAATRRWAWTVTQYFTTEEIAKMNNLDPEITKKDHEVVKKSHEKLFEVTDPDAPNVNPDPTNCEHFENKLQRIWHACNAGKETPIPWWMSKCIEREIAIFGEQRSKLTVKREKALELADESVQKKKSLPLTRDCLT